MATPDFLGTIAAKLSESAMRDFIQFLAKVYINKGQALSSAGELAQRPEQEVREIFKHWMAKEVGETTFVELPPRQPDVLLAPSANDMRHFAVSEALGTMPDGDLAGGYHKSLREQAVVQERHLRNRQAIAKASPEQLEKVFQSDDKESQAAAINVMIGNWLTKKSEEPQGGTVNAHNSVQGSNQRAVQQVSRRW